MRRLDIGFFYPIILLTFLLSCQSREKQHSFIITDYKSNNWKTSLITDNILLSDALQNAENYNVLYSLLIARNDTLILEKYFNNTSDSSAFNVMSITKSITSALVGIAVKENLIPSEDSKIKDLLPGYFQEGINDDKSNITIHQLLTMQGGYNFHSTRDIFSTGDWIKNILNYPLSFKPGNEFCYASCESHLLSAVIYETSGMTVEDFASKHLFGPLCIHYVDWEKDPKGINLGNKGIFMTSRDLLRYGQLYSDSGKYKEIQIIPKKWVEKSIIDYSENKPRCKESKIIPFSGYGYNWWLDEFNGRKAVIASGFGGNFIMIFPEIQLVIVTTADNFVNWRENEENVNNIIKLVKKIIEIIDDK